MNPTLAVTVPVVSVVEGGAVNVLRMGWQDMPHGRGKLLVSRVGHATDRCESRAGLLAKRGQDRG